MRSCWEPPGQNESVKGQARDAQLLASIGSVFTALYSNATLGLTCAHWQRHSGCVSSATETAQSLALGVRAPALSDANSRLPRKYHGKRLGALNLGALFDALKAD